MHLLAFNGYHNGSAVGSNSDTYDPGQLTTVQTHAFYCVVTDACGFLQILTQKQLQLLMNHRSQSIMAEPIV